MKKLYLFDKSAFLFLLFNLLFFVSPAQWYDPEKVNSKAAELHEQAYNAAQDGKYNEAIAKIKQAVSIEPKFVDAYLSIDLPAPLYCTGDWCGGRKVEDASLAGLAVAEHLAA